MDAFLVRTSQLSSGASGSPLESNNEGQLLSMRNKSEKQSFAIISPKALEEQPTQHSTEIDEKDNSSLSLLKKENEKLRSDKTRLIMEVKQLRAQNSKLKSDAAHGLATKKRKSDVEGAVGCANIEPANKKFRTPAQRRKLLEKWHKALKRESAKKKITNAWGSESYSVEIKETVPWSKAEIDALFVDGIKIQPTAQNKPTSVITILQYDTEKMKNFFRNDIPDFDTVGDYSVQLWRSRNFCKSYRQGTGESRVDTMEVHWNKSKQQLSLTFGMRFLDAC